WVPVNTGLAHVSDAERIELAISAKLDGGNSPVYAAIVNKVEGDVLAVAGAKDSTTIDVATGTLLQGGDRITVFAADHSQDFVILSMAAVAGGKMRLTLNGKLDQLYPLGSKVTIDPDERPEFRLSGVFRSADNGAHWNPLPLPGTNETTGFFG